MNFGTAEDMLDWMQASSYLAFIRKDRQDPGLTKAAQELYLTCHQRICADMITDNTAPYSMSRWKPEEERLRSDIRLPLFLPRGTGWW